MEQFYKSAANGNQNTDYAKVELLNKFLEAFR